MVQMQLGQLTVTPPELAWGMVVALGILIIVRDLLRASDQLRMASEAGPYLADPNKLAGEALDHLGQDPDITSRGYREEEQDG